MHGIVHTYMYVINIHTYFSNMYITYFIFILFYARDMQRADFRKNFQESKIRNETDKLIFILRLKCLGERWLDQKDIDIKSMSI